MSIIRTRWAAIGAAIAVTLGAGGIGLVSATQPDNAATFVPITPCRVMDTRTEFNVGPKATPLGTGETYTVNTTTGNTGNCTDIPTTATGVSLNVTALDATLPTFLTVWATGEPQPEASSLNPVPGTPPTPNAVTTGINTNGQFNIYNLQGNVQVIADINGYYTDHNHDDRYYTKNQTDDRYYTKNQTDDRYYTKAQIDAMLAATTASVSSQTQSAGTVSIGDGETETVVSASLTPPANGDVMAVAIAPRLTSDGTSSFACSLSTNSNMHPSSTQDAGILTGQIVPVRGFTVTSGAQLSVNLVCTATDGTVDISGASVRLIYFPS